MSAASKTDSFRYELIRRYGVQLLFDDANALRRAAKTLHTWAEHECGGGNEWSSWSIERDETTGKPFWCNYPNREGMKPTRRPIADREKGALKRIATICSKNGSHFYHQTDPRGCSLFISKEPLTDQNYNSAGIAVVS